MIVTIMDGSVRLTVKLKFTGEANPSDVGCSRACDVGSTSGHFENWVNWYSDWKNYSFLAYFGKNDEFIGVATDPMTNEHFAFDAAK